LSGNTRRKCIILPPIFLDKNIAAKMAATTAESSVGKNINYKNIDLSVEVRAM
jgi:hypothetical protein